MSTELGEQEVLVRQAILHACRSMAGLGLNQGMSGNISVRAAARMIITPSATPYDAMTPADMVRVSIGAGEPEGRLAPSSEWHFHHDIYVSRPDVGAIVHAHPTYCTALSMARRGIPACHYMVATFGGDDVRCCGYATFGTPALSVLVVQALQDRQACLLANHGMIACGRDLAQAMWRAVELEAVARQYCASLAFGGPVLLSAEEMAAATRRFESYRP
jgi:L-fuculose-phosphate aldolase